LNIIQFFQMTNKNNLIIFCFYKEVLLKIMYIVLKKELLTYTKFVLKKNILRQKNLFSKNTPL